MTYNLTFTGYRWINNEEAAAFKFETPAALRNAGSFSFANVTELVIIKELNSFYVQVYSIANELTRDLYDDVSEWKDETLWLEVDTDFEENPHQVLINELKEFGILLTNPLPKDL